MTDYSRAKIYKLVNDVDDEVYIGSTTDPLNDRFCRHKWDATSRERPKSKLYKHMNNLGFEHFKIELIEDYPCNNKTELEIRESELIKKYGSLNIVIPDRTKNEYRKQYYERNKNIINEKKREKITCICGMKIRKDSLKKHLISQNHINLIKTMELEKN